MWKMSDNRWLNPLAISYVSDAPDKDKLTVFLGSNQHWLEVQGPERQVLLAFLAQHSQHVFLAQDDEPPF